MFSTTKSDTNSTTTSSSANKPTTAAEKLEKYLRALLLDEKWEQIEDDETMDIDERLKAAADLADLTVKYEEETTEATIADDDDDHLKFFIVDEMVADFARSKAKQLIGLCDDAIKDSKASKGKDDADTVKIKQHKVALAKKATIVASSLYCIVLAVALLYILFFEN